MKRERTARYLDTGPLALPVPERQPLMARTVLGGAERLSSARCTLAVASSSTTAGIRPGEILVCAAGSELRSITTINDATRARTLSVETVRGENTSLELAMTCVRSPATCVRSPAMTSPRAIPPRRPLRPPRCRSETTSVRTSSEA